VTSVRCVSFASAGCSLWLGDSMMTSWCPMAGARLLVFLIWFEVFSLFGGVKAG